MVIEFSKEKLNEIENFIREALFHKDELHDKVRTGDYSYFELYKLLSMDFYITGMLMMINASKLQMVMGVPSKNVEFSIKGYDKNIKLSEISSNIKVLLEKVRNHQIKDMIEIKKDINEFEELDDEIRYDVTCNMYINVIYGMKIIADILGYELDGKFDAKEILTPKESKFQNEHLNNTRRNIGLTTEVIEKKIKLVNEMKVVISRREILEKRIARLNILKSIGANNKEFLENEEKYLNSRIVFFETEMISFREEYRSVSNQIEENRKNNLLHYIGKEEKECLLQSN